MGVAPHIICVQILGKWLKKITEMLQSSYAWFHPFTSTIKRMAPVAPPSVTVHVV